MVDFEVFVGIDVAKAGLDAHVHPSGQAFHLSNDRAGRTICRIIRIKAASIPASRFSGSWPITASPVR